MEKKRARPRDGSPVETADELLASAVESTATSAGKSSLKTLIWSLSPSSPLCPTLPPALHLAISRSLSSFKSSSNVGASSSGDPDETSDLLKELRSYAYVAHLCSFHPKKPFSLEELFPSVRLLHDNLLLFDLDSGLLSLVAGLCEQWWKEDFSGRESLISQSLPFLISKSLTQGKKVDVRRVYALRDALVLFDYVDESIEDTRLLLVRCVITPVYLKTEEGRKFIAFVLGLNGRLMKEALALIRSQIPFGRKSVLEAYAEILFRSWKGLQGDLRGEMEDGFLQGLIEGAIHASSRPLAASVRRVLGGFVQQRAVDGVEKLLFRLAEPVLFRSLQVSNPNVRLNALHLLLDLFPLEDPDVTKEAKDTLLEKQFYLLDRLVLDDCPDVRAVAVEGSCRILHLFWEVIPSSTITNILKKIIYDISHDTCTEVRLSTVNGIIYLLDNPQTHEIMKVLLPKLGFMFTDHALSVRVAVADLLLVVRDIRTFQFHKVVSLDTLLSALSSDHTTVAQKVTRLLIPSYFPYKVSHKEACSRCIALIKRSPKAGARFCEFQLSEGSSLKSLIELLRVSSSLAVSTKDLNADQIDGFFLASANICRSLLTEPSCKATLCEIFSGDKLKHMFTAAGSPCAKSAVLAIASVVSPDDLMGFHDQLMTLVTDCVGISENLELQSVVQAAHKLILSCGWFDELFESVANILHAIASGYATEFGLEMPQRGAQAGKKKKVKLAMKSPVGTCNSSRKGSKVSQMGMSNIEEDFAIASAAAWQVKILLKNLDTRMSMLRSPSLQKTIIALRIISQVCIEQCMQWESLDVSPIMAYTSFAIHISLQNVRSAVSESLGGDKNNASQFTSPYLEQATLDQSLNHLFNCFEKLSCERPCKSGNTCSSFKQEVSQHRRSTRIGSVASSSHPTEDPENRTPSQKMGNIQNMVKLVTSVLKLIADATTIGVISDNQTQCLRFVSASVQHIISFFRRNQYKNSSYQEEDLKYILALLKSSFTYGAKLLHFILMTSTDASAPPEVFHLCSDLLDLIASLESYMGSRLASVLLSASKPWLPVIILGLGFNKLVAGPNEGKPKSDGFYGRSLPEWLAILSKAETFDGSQSKQIDQRAPVLETLMDMMLLLLKKGDAKIREAIGFIFLTGIEFGLGRGDFDLVFGLSHYTCLKLFGGEGASQKELNDQLLELCLRIERMIEDPDVNEEGKQKLESAKRIIESVPIHRQ
ncbi:hypothetical protein J5N97_028543 [Dioscorea zingiberensis]|uniref:Condensin-2 complex subunit G2 n=1 Tax=Dioscorea zingiberensis TaxID=325984 RepID=A0A9D5H4X7_9LILI|nr:hypothetical protein J5N97_028543 [Dioscorea zingiberensis]